MTWLQARRLLAYLFFSFFAIPPLLFAASLLRYWLMIQFRSGIYLEYPYLTVGLAFLCVGLLEIFCVIQGIRRKGLWRALLAVPVILGLATMINVPEIVPEDRESNRHLIEVLQKVDSFSREHGRFPATAAELEQLSAATTSLSPYRENGQSLHHRVVLIPSASGPYSGNVGKEPGVLFYAVNSEYKEAWLAETQLDRPVGGQVQFVNIFTEDGYSTFFHRQISPNWPVQ
jgi:hypothetical protein